MYNIYFINTQYLLDVKLIFDFTHVYLNYNNYYSKCNFFKL